MSFLIFVEAISRLIEKIVELSFKRRREEEQIQRQSVVQLRPIVYDCRYATIRVDPQKLAIIDPSLYVDIPLLIPPRNLVPELAGQEKSEGSTGSGPSTIVLSSRELITPYVAEALREMMGIEVEPDIKSESEKEKGKRGG